MNSAELLFAGLAILSLLLGLWQWVAGRRFPLHQAQSSHGKATSVTIFKPLKGLDPHTRDCLRSWFELDYPGQIQILFGVASAEDPVCGLVEELIAEHPNRPARLVICGGVVGANAKVSTLSQLERHAQHALWVISDADVRAPRSLLQSLVSELVDDRVGLVNCFYRMQNPSTIAMHWQSTGINGDFWAQVLQARDLGVLDFGLGATMATWRAQMEAIGGFRELADFVADDFQLGQRIVGQGKTIRLGKAVVECWEPSNDWHRVWRQQLRWARTIRVCRPIPYFFSILANGSLWSLMWLLVSLLAVSFPMYESWRIAALPMACLAVRVAACLSNQRRLTGAAIPLRWGWFVPVADVLHAIVWVLSFLGNRIEWRGREYRLLRGGRLVPCIK